VVIDPSADPEESELTHAPIRRRAHGNVVELIEARCDAWYRAPVKWTLGVELKLIGIQRGGSLQRIRPR
jgi:hypothetical protein